MRFAILILAALCPLMAETRVIGYAQDGKTPIVAEIKPGYSGVGGSIAVLGLDGTPGEANADVVIKLANPLKSKMQFPPTGSPYRDFAESWVVWRWLEMHGHRTVQADAALMDALPKLLPADELRRRRARTPKQVAEELAKVFGHNFNQLTYLPGMALIGQLRLGNTEEVTRLAAPYLTRDTLRQASSLTLAGHQVFAELAKRTGDAKYIELVRKVGELGVGAESMPYHGEMSDSYFMAGPITAMAGTLTGDKKYYDIVAKHFRFMDKLVLREDGLYRHSPLTDAAWGRGNAFALLGMTLALSEFPQDHPDRAYILGAVRRHLQKLATLQDADGMWHEILDEPGSYAETSATAMIATAMLRAIRQGWVDAKEYQPRVDRAWQAVMVRMADDGSLIDVCESTNKQPSREAYLTRAALAGPDERGGGMMLYFATEMLEAN
jgi:rhamnogalacturonyl hydrolase YesR